MLSSELESFKFGPESGFESHALTCTLVREIVQETNVILEDLQEFLLFEYLELLLLVKLN